MTTRARRQGVPPDRTALDDAMRLYLGRIRVILPTCAGIAIIVLGLLVSHDALVRVGIVALFSGAVAGPTLALLGRFAGLTAAVRTSAYVDTLLVAFASTQFDEPRVWAVTYMWGIFVAATLLGPRDAFAVTTLAVACAVALPLVRDIGDPALVGVDAIIIASVGCFMAIIRVSELRAIEERRSLEELLREAQRLAHVGSFEWDGATDTSRWSEEMYRIFGVPIDARPLGLAEFVQTIVEEDREHAQRSMEAAMSGEREFASFDATIRRPDGELRVIHSIGTPVGPPDGPPRIFGSIQDVTELRRLDDLREEFVAAASHELRTPTTIVAGFASTLVREWDRISDIDRRRYVGEIDDAARRLALLIEDVLQVSEIESGNVRARHEAFDLRATVDELVHSWPGELAVDVVPAAPDPVFAVGDSERTVQIVTNLLANVERLGPDAMPVQVRVVVDGDRAVVFVDDHGPGIAADDLERIFDRFVRLDLSAPGTGLGLYISRKLAEVQGGALDVESVPGEGTSFRLSIPAAAGRVDA